jgi:hypothetical protein
VRWFEEFMATYLGMGYLWHTEGTTADPIRTDLLDAIPDSLLRYTSLADFEARPLEEFLTPEGWANYGWYQGQFADRGRQVFEQQGLAFIARVREELPWDRYAEWRTEELLGWLEAIEPGFLAWARSLERRSESFPGPVGPGSDRTSTDGRTLRVSSPRPTSPGVTPSASSDQYLEMPKT